MKLTKHLWLKLWENNFAVCTNMVEKAKLCMYFSFRQNVLPPNRIMYVQTASRCVYPLESIDPIKISPPLIASRYSFKRGKHIVTLSVLLSKFLFIKFFLIHSPVTCAITNLLSRIGSDLLTARNLAWLDDDYVRMIIKDNTDETKELLRRM